MNPSATVHQKNQTPSLGKTTLICSAKSSANLLSAWGCPPPTRALGGHICTLTAPRQLWPSAWLGNERGKGTEIMEASIMEADPSSLQSLQCCPLQVLLKILQKVTMSQRRSWFPALLRAREDLCEITADLTHLQVKKLQTGASSFYFY